MKNCETAFSDNVKSSEKMTLIHEANIITTDCFKSNNEIS